MKPTYNVLLVMNKSTWDYAELQVMIAKVRKKYEKYATLNIYVMYTFLDTVIWKKGTFTTNLWVRDDKTIDPKFYDENFVKPALKKTWDMQVGIDIICVALMNEQIETKTTRGACDWGNTNAGMVECWIAGDPKDTYYVDGTAVARGFEANLGHEISHAINFFNGQKDTTHEFQVTTMGNMPSVKTLKAIRATPMYYANKAGFRTLRNYFRRLWNLF